jgi:nicotinate-nucleotide pyrophosphorylase
MIEFPSAAADLAVLAAPDEDAAACDLTTQWSVPDGLVSEATIVGRAHGIIAGITTLTSQFSPPSPTSASTSLTPAKPLPASERWTNTRSGPVAAPTTA